MENLFNVNQAAFILKVHPLTIRRYIKEGVLKAVKIGGNIRIKESSLQTFSRDFTPRQDISPANPFRKSANTTVKRFTSADPLLKMQGRAATVDF
ncbi:MAG: helix-turn-helix domain-containing protein [Candidatus Levybacteria bacterium]|nr:helix-turn-helix domain-containing protein [Candidatus Levybacteria bacterium]